MPFPVHLRSQNIDRGHLEVQMRWGDNGRCKPEICARFQVHSSGLPQAIKFPADYAGEFSLPRRTSTPGRLQAVRPACICSTRRLQAAICLDRRELLYLRGFACRGEPPWVTFAALLFLYARYRGCTTGVLQPICSWSAACPLVS